MAIIRANLDYTDKDFDALRARLFALIESVFPQWTARQVANFGNILIEMYAFVGDVLGKYQDNQARESRWSQATQRKNLIALAKLITYEPATATASQVDVTITIPAAVAGDVTFPAGTIVRTKQVTDPVVFRLVDDATIQAGATQVVATAENAEDEEDTFTSPGTPDFEVSLTATPYIDGSAIVTAANGLFTEVDNFLDSDSTDKHFTVTVDQNDKATIRFGNGVAGVIPTGTITVLYKTGGGTAGVVEAGTVTVIEGSFTDEFGTSVTPSVTNAAASTPATDRESIAQIRQNAPLSLRALNRTVAREDFEINAERLAAVGRALMLTSNEDPAIGENSGYLFVLPVGGGTPTQDLLDAVETQVTVTYPHTLTFTVNVAAPVFKTVDVYARIWLDKGANPTTTKAAIVANLAAFFSPENSDGTKNEDIGFGCDYIETAGDAEGALPLSDLFNVVRDTSGVRKIGDGLSDFTLNTLHEDVDLLLREFPILGTVTIINGETGLAI